MKAITYMLAVALAVFAGTDLWAIPAGFNVQGRLTDSNGINKDGTFQIKFSVFATDTGGSSAVWEKNISSVIVKNGNFQIILQGQGENSIQLETALKDLEAAYVEIKVGNEPPLVPRQPLLRSPFTPLYSAHTTAGRPASPSIGTIMFNTDLNKPEYYDGTKWMTFTVKAAGDLSITGGDRIVTIGDYTVHEFLSGTKNLEVVGTGVVNYFILGGGGGGGPIEGGGGGGGGKLTGTYTVSAGVYPITVGGAAPAYTKGNDSSAFGLTAIGGGRGASGGGSGRGGDGGCGGGGGSTSGTGGTGAQGYNGGTAQYPFTGGGGGGAGGFPGGPFYVDGGMGYTLPLNGVTYGGGGGGGNGQGQSFYGVGSTGGGGSGGLNGPGSPGTNGLGGGGGGGGNTGYYTFGGGAGGSGVVIIWYLTP